MKYIFASRVSFAQNYFNFEARFFSKVIKIWLPTWFFQNQFNFDVQREFLHYPTFNTRKPRFWRQTSFFFKFFKFGDQRGIFNFQRKKLVFY